jgi:calcium/calmodulin-dependent protein kinase I
LQDQDQERTIQQLQQECSTLERCRSEWKDSEDKWMQEVQEWLTKLRETATADPYAQRGVCTLLGTIEKAISRKAKRTAARENLGMIEHESAVTKRLSIAKPFETLYTWCSLIEQGAFFTTREAQHNQSQEIVSIKSFRRTDMETEDAVALQAEISTLKLLSDCPRVVKLYDVLEDPDFTYIVMERLHGGTLLDCLAEKKYYTENEARSVIKNLLLAVEYCHNRRIAHRNINLENITPTVHANAADVKLCDFGMAKRVLYPNALSTQCGTEGYVAPDILVDWPEYDVHCDIWSVGVVFYTLLGGYRPFRGDDMVSKSRHGEFKFHKRYWSEISEEAKILIVHMLTVEPIARVTATSALNSDWILMAKEERSVERGEK